MKPLLWLLVAGAMWSVWKMRMDEARLVLAQTIYGEARGEGRTGMEAVASVIMNRAVIGGWWGDSVISVAKARYQFSAWNENDPNRAIIETKRPGQGDAVFDEAYQIAGEAIAGKVTDATGGATHYHTAAVNPPWADADKITTQIGGHIFYRGIA